MGLSFIGNPCEPEEWGDSDIEIPNNDEWITIPNTVTVNPLDSSEEEDEEDSWPDTDDNDVDYNPDDENYEQEAEIEDFIADQSDCSFDNVSDDDYDDEDDIDYVTFSPLPISSSDNITPATNKTSEVTTSNQDDACVDAD